MSYQHCTSHGTNENGELIEKYQNTKVEKSDSESLQELLEDLENDREFEALTEKRLEHLQKEFKLIERAVEEFGDSAGTIHYYSNERELMDAVAKAETSIVHFYQPTFPRCKAMNNVLELFAEKHLPIQVMAIRAEDASFLVSKLRVKVLPLVLIYKKGQEVARIVGFEGVGGSENIVSLQTLEAYFIQRNVITRTTINTKSVRNKDVTTKDDNDNESSDDWW